MADAAASAGAVVWGGLLALVYLGGLAWTVRRVRGARHPLAIVAASFVLRGAIVVVGLVMVMRGDVVRLLLAFGGFLLARAVVLWWVRTRHAGA
jgi:F1F0 ATPase subunit 2